MIKIILVSSVLSVFCSLNVNAVDVHIEEHEKYSSKKPLVMYSELSTQENDNDQKMTFNKVIVNNTDEDKRLESHELFDKAVKLSDEGQYKKSIPLFEKIAQYNVNAQYNLGVLYEGGYGCQKSLTKAIEYYTIAASKGHKGAEKQYKALIDKKNKESKSIFSFFY